MRTERVEAADVAQIYKLWNEYSAAISSKDLERWMALWSENGIQMPPDAPQCSGKAQIQEFLQAQFDQSLTKLSINPEVVRILDDRAYTHGSFISMVTSKEGADKITIQRSGKFLTVLEKQADGSWKILIDCFNYTSPVE